MRTVKSTKDIKKGETAWVKRSKHSVTSSLYTKDSSGRCYHMGVIKDNESGRTSPVYTD